MKSRKILALILTIALLITGSSHTPLSKAEESVDDTISSGQIEQIPEISSELLWISSVNSLPDQTVSLTWQYTQDVFSYFEIYRAESVAGTYTEKDLVFSHYDDYNSETSTYTQSWVDSNVLMGQTYYYKILAFFDSEYEDSYLMDKAYTPVSSVQVTLSATTIENVKSLDEDRLSISWAGIPAAHGYELYRCPENSTEYQPICSLDSATTSYEDTAVEFGSSYSYKVVAFHTDASGMCHVSTSEAITGTVTYSPVTIKKIKLKNEKTVKVSWTKHNKSKGYEVYRAKTMYDSSGEELNYKKIKTIHSKSKCSLKVTKLKNGMTYYYKVRAIGTVNGKKLEGEFSKQKKRLMNVYGFDWESYDGRVKRIFKNNRFKYFKSDAQARKNMKTIRIKTWDINGSGKKYTRTFSLTVHKNIAPTVKKIFKEIYNGKEKFPIHDIGGYSWRGNESEHCLGLAIDINANENYMIDGKKVLAGSFWRPKKNPYSIPTDGEVAKIMQKYGFYQGLWGNRRDYMHFSYFGG